MGLAGHKLDLYILGALPLQDYCDDLRLVLSDLQAEGALDSTGSPKDASVLIEGGVVRVRLEAPTGPRFYSNTKGGFRAACSVCSYNLTGVFASAVTAWREGGRSEEAARTATVVCRRCGHTCALTDTSCQPEAGFGWGALVLHDAASLRLTTRFHDLLVSHLGSYRVVGTRA